MRSVIHFVDSKAREMSRRAKSKVTPLVSAVTGLRRSMDPKTPARGSGNGNPGASLPSASPSALKLGGRDSLGMEASGRRLQFKDTEPLQQQRRSVRIANDAGVAAALSRAAEISRALSQMQAEMDNLVAELQRAMPEAQQVETPSTAPARVEKPAASPLGIRPPAKVVGEGETLELVRKGGVLIDGVFTSGRD